MRTNLSLLIDKIIFPLIFLIVLLVPIIFLPLTSDFYEMPKFFLLSLLTLLAASLWVLKWILNGNITFSRTPLDIPLLLLLAAILLSSFFSPSKYIVLFGNMPLIHGSAISWVIYILFYFVLVSNLSSKKQIKILLFTLLFSGTIVALISVFSYFGVYLLGNNFLFSKFPNFSLTGSTFSTSALLLILIPLASFGLAIGKKLSVTNFILTFILSLALLLTSSKIVFAVFILEVLFILGLAFKQEGDEKKLNFFLILLSFILAFVIFILAFLPLNFLSFFQEKRDSFPQEIQLPLDISWKISALSLRDSPILGSGPSTYLFDFNQYKPAEFNTSNFWNLRFQTSFNEFTQVLAELGILGFLALIYLCFKILSLAVEGFWQNKNPLERYLKFASILVVVLLLIHTTTLISAFLLFLIPGFLSLLYKSEGRKVDYGVFTLLSSKDNQNYYITKNSLTLVISLVILLVVIYGIWSISRFFLADFTRLKALNSSSGLIRAQSLISATNLNPNSDLYRIDLSQTTFSLANLIAQQKGPSESSPSGSLSQEDLVSIQQLISESITQAKIATILSPLNSRNWELLGSIYRQIIGVAPNASQFALDSYSKAILLDPTNPLLRLQMGLLYYSLKNYDLAVRFFSDAVNLKPDYTNAYYNLSIALREKGNLNEAENIAEAALPLIPKDSSDYKIINTYLEDLRARIATGSANQSQITLTEATSSALQQQELEDAITLPDKPGQIATPSAVPSKQD